MRFFFLIILVAGIALGIGYPWAVDNVSGYEIGRYRVYDRDSGFQTAEVALAPSEAPVRVLVDLTAAGEFRPSDRLAVLTVTASTGGATVFAETVTFVGVPPRPDSPQVAGYVYRDEAGVIDPVSGDARYVFTVGPRRRHRDGASRSNPACWRLRSRSAGRACRLHPDGRRFRRLRGGVSSARPQEIVQG
jgi:hypothetical protein